MPGWSDSNDPERWQSGRMRQTRNLLYGYPYRGFESLSLRQIIEAALKGRFNF